MATRRAPAPERPSVPPPYELWILNTLLLVWAIGLLLAELATRA